MALLSSGLYSVTDIPWMAALRKAIRSQRWVFNSHRLANSCISSLASSTSLTAGFGEA